MSMLQIAFSSLSMSVVVGDRLDRVNQATDVLQSHYDSNSGYWDAHGFWNSGNSLEALSNAIIYSANEKYAGVLANTFNRYEYDSELKNNKYLDDLQWWGLAWTRAYEASGDAQFLAHSRAYHNKAVEYWDNTCGGGVWWSKDKGYKNAITNELFLSLSTRMYMVTLEQSYLDWSNKSYVWFMSSGMVNNAYLINDGLNKNCENNGGMTWTYNQGVLFGGLIDLFQIHRDSSYLDLACRIADAVIEHKTLDGILKESCDPASCGNDGEQFKGVFMRYLGYLVNALPISYANQKTKYADFIATNAESLWTASRGVDGRVAESWEQLGSSPATTTTHTAGMDCLNADLLLKGYSKKPLYSIVGYGNCNPDRPQWYQKKSAYGDCKAACDADTRCIGLDFDSHGSGCRVRFARNADIVEAPSGFDSIDGSEGDGFSGAGGSNTAVCYQKQVAPYSMVGTGNCSPDRPQWYRQGCTFAVCQAECDVTAKCIGFDFDSNGDGCRIRFTRNADIVGPPSGFGSIDGKEGDGFSGAGGSSTATCYKKQNVDNNMDVFL